MKTSSTDILIIGAGISGLTIAYYLHQHNISFKIIEARKRIGGRVYSKRDKGFAPIELGATWITKEHQQLLKILQELKIDIFEQQLGDHAVYEPTAENPPQVVPLPPNNSPSYRITGGTDELIKALVSSINGYENISTNSAVVSMTEEDHHINIITTSETFTAKKVISTVPPCLLINSIKFSPSLPTSLVTVASNTHTWMGESIKIGLRYEKPFWRNKGTSGTIFSSVGPVSEMYDHSNKEETQFALKGFFNGDYHSISKNERLEMALNQLRKYYGDIVNDYSSYEEIVWKKEAFTSDEYEDLVYPHQNNGDKVYQKTYFNGKLFLSGSETSPHYAGYMEGAIESAQIVANEIIKNR
jgi:monoamine oxidase